MTVVHGRYGVYDPMWLAFGRPNNASQSNLAIRSNAWSQKLSTTADGALAATEEGCVIPVPVQEGDIISKVTILIGGTEGKETEAGYAALYAGKKSGKLLAQSKSKKYEGASAFTKNKPFTFELEKSVLITSVNAENGWLYVVIAIESPTGVAGVIPTVVTSAVPKACQYEWFTGGPEVLSGTAGTGLKTAAEATLGAITSKAVAPLVFLS
jgi:hypothetical protein